MSEETRGRSETSESAIPRAKRRKLVELDDPWDAVLDWELTGQGKALEEQTMKAIAKYYAYHRHQQKKTGRGRRGQLWTDTCKTFGISRSTLGKITRSIKANGSVPKVSHKRPREPLRLNSLDDEKLLEVRSWIYSAAIAGRPYFLNSIIKEVDDKWSIKISKSTMGRILRMKLALRFSKIRSHGTKIQNDRILVLLKTYLQKLEELMPLVKAGQRLLVFTDESYIHPSHAIKQYWFHVQDQDRVFGSPKGRGRRIILVHFGCKEGWIPGGEHVWECTGKETDATGDYHGNVNGEWWMNMFEKVCQQLKDRKKQCIFVMDNAKYHKLVGNPELDAIYWPGRTLSTALKPQLLKYLKDHNIPHENPIKVDDARKLARQHYQKDGLRLVQTARKYGHDILFTPPYWPQLQPIEMAWGQVKNFVARNRKGNDYTVEETLKLVKLGFEQVTPQVWEDMINNALNNGWTIKQEIAHREQLTNLAEDAAAESDDDVEEDLYSGDEDDVYDDEN